MTRGSLARWSDVHHAVGTLHRDHVAPEQERVCVRQELRRVIDRIRLDALRLQEGISDVSLSERALPRRDVEAQCCSTLARHLACVVADDPGDEDQIEDHDAGEPALGAVWLPRRGTPLEP